jgi:hypothetical protein
MKGSSWNWRATWTLRESFSSSVRLTRALSLSETHGIIESQGFRVDPRRYIDDAKRIVYLLNGTD